MTSSNNSMGTMSNKSSNKSNKSSKSNRNNKTHKKMRVLGRWYIGQTIGKGSCSWVKKGYDKKTGKCVALKFMAKARGNEAWATEQQKRVATEIESLKQIRHPNVIKLYAYNLNAKYPCATSKKEINTILLVLQFAPGGELFDILYYTSALEEILARTYFWQTISGLEACHNAGIAHRDIKPQNLLLDGSFNIKIADFGLSKLFESDADAIMKTSYVGTRGFQAPELLLGKPYGISCDIFSLGVVLFLLINGYPPFEQAQASDRWYKPLISNNFAKFWKYHRECNIINNKFAMDLLQRMLCFDPRHRITISQIKKHPWFINGEFLAGRELIRALRHRHRAMEEKRKQDNTKNNLLSYSYGNGKSVFPKKTHQIRVNLFPKHETEGIMDTYTTMEPTTFVHSMIHIIEMHNGRATVDDTRTRLNCRLQFQPANKNDNGACSEKVNQVVFSIQWWKSREYNMINEEASDASEEQEEQEEVFCIRMRRVEGSFTAWRSIRLMLLQKGTLLFTGLPPWVETKKLESNEC